MGWCLRSTIVLVALASWWIASRLNATPPLPEVDPNPWWGPGEPREQDTNIRPFKIEIPVEVNYDDQLMEVYNNFQPVQYTQINCSIAIISQRTFAEVDNPTSAYHFLGGN